MSLILDLFVLAAIVPAIWGLSENHPQEVFSIWYAFSFCALIFGALYAAGYVENKEVTYVFGPEYNNALTKILDYLTNWESEVIFVCSFVYVTVGPQILSYVVSGLSGTAITPMFVKWIWRIAVWSLIKFSAALSGILFGRTIASAIFSPANEQFHNIMEIESLILLSFLFANAYHDYFEGGFNINLPGIVITVGKPRWFDKIHRAFTRNNGAKIRAKNMLISPFVNMTYLGRKSP